MRLLIVEDEEADLQDVLESLSMVGYQGQTDIARSRDTALQLLDTNDYDLIICDIRIPTSDGGLDLSEDHGFLVHSEGRRLSPGTPQLFLTGQATPRNIKEQIGRGGTGEAFGQTDWIMVQLAEKDAPAECEHVLRSALDSAALLEQSVRVDARIALSERLESAVRTFAVRHRGSRCEVAPRSGLSGAEVARVSLFDDGGALRGSAFLKLLPCTDADDEMQRYEQFVPTMLAPGLFAPAMRPISTGLGRQGALLFTVADPTSIDFFELAQSNDADAASTAMRLFEGLHPWSGNVEQRSTTLTELRQAWAPDSALVQAGLTDLLDSEDLELELSYCVSHGDLHGQNILVSQTTRPMLIDFADTGMHPSATDPVVLELSFLFHRERPHISSWPDEAQCRLWAEASAFHAQSPFRETLGACREEALRRATEREVAAVTYCHSLRQLKYPDVDNRLAAEVARSARAQLS